jgi:hypothetical protein
VPDKRVCGIDFDNTIVNYNELLARIARERGLVDSGTPASKRTIRDWIRLLPDGETEWQKCQALMYGSRIQEARLSDGVGSFIQLCHRNRVQIYVISHKTEYSRHDTTGTNLRDAALNWMAANGFFEPNRLGLTRDRIFFAETRQEKILRLTQTGCTDFIDDLEETFLEGAFPADIRRILYEPGRQCPPPSGVKLTRSWQEISDYFFA